MTRVTDPDLIRPRAPHDDFSFQELSRSYNFCKTSGRNRVFVRLLIKECQRQGRPVRVLDIGCGRGIATKIDWNKALRPYIDEYWGIEPDNSIVPDVAVFDRTQHAPMETAELPENYFDLAYSSCVMEHVADPDSFMSAVKRCLAPGGTYLFVTPNHSHYFGITTSILNRLGVDEFAFRLLKGEGKGGYHYPVYYRFNSERRIKGCAARLGFLPPEFAYMEEYGPVPYMKGPLRLLLYLFAFKRRVIWNPRVLITMACRIRKPSNIAASKVEESA